MAFPIKAGASADFLFSVEVFLLLFTKLFWFDNGIRNKVIKGFFVFFPSRNCHYRRIITSNYIQLRSVYEPCQGFGPSIRTCDGPVAICLPGNSGRNIKK